MLRLLTIPLVFGMILAACLVWSLDTVTSPPDFTFVNRGDHKTLDIGAMSWEQDIRVAYGLWEGLYRLDPQTLDPIPGVAEFIDIDPAKVRYTFHLRASARWSNGEPVKSGDFIFAWRRMLEQPAEYTSLFFYIHGARDYDKAYARWVSDADAGSGKTIAPAPDFAQVGISAPDDRTLVVTLDDPTPFFASLCAFPPFFPQYEPCMRAFADVDGKTGRVASYREEYTRPPNLVSNGPYRLSQWEFKRRLRMVASNYYWNPDSVKSKVIDEKVIEDPLAALRAYLSGQVDWLCDVDSRLMGEMVTEHSRPDLHTFVAFGTYYWTFNCLDKLPDGRPNPLANPLVRQALAMSIDKRPIVENVTRAGEPIVNVFVPRGVFTDYPSPPGLSYDPAKARQLLAQAGYPDGKGFPALTMLYNAEGSHADIALILRSQWQANLGIQLNTEQVEIKVFGSRLQKRDYDIARASWFGDYIDPTTFLDKYLSDNEDNSAGWANPAFDHIVNQAHHQRDRVQRMHLLAQAEDIMLNDAPILPLYQYVTGYLYRDNVTGIPSNLRNMSLLQSAMVRR